MCRGNPLVHQLLFDLPGKAKFPDLIETHTHPSVQSIDLF